MSTHVSRRCAAIQMQDALQSPGAETVEPAKPSFTSIWIDISRQVAHTLAQRPAEDAQCSKQVCARHARQLPRQAPYGLVRQVIFKVLCHILWTANGYTHHSEASPLRGSGIINHGYANLVDELAFNGREGSVLYDHQRLGHVDRQAASVEAALSFMQVGHNVLIKLSAVLLEQVIQERTKWPQLCQPHAASTVSSSADCRCNTTACSTAPATPAITGHSVSSASAAALVAMHASTCGGGGTTATPTTLTSNISPMVRNWVQQVRHSNCKPQGAKGVTLLASQV
jgi:hypothetical protein